MGQEGLPLWGRGFTNLDASLRTRNNRRDVAFMGMFMNMPWRRSPGAGRVGTPLVRPSCWSAVFMRADPFSHGRPPGRRPQRRKRFHERTNRTDGDDPPIWGRLGPYLRWEDSQARRGERHGSGYEDSGNENDQNEGGCEQDGGNHVDRSRDEDASKIGSGQGSQGGLAGRWQGEVGRVEGENRQTQGRHQADQEELNLFGHLSGAPRRAW
jgi:hypothetical protein